MNKTPLFLIILLLLFITVPLMAVADTSPIVPKPGMVTMVDLGAHTCIPCKMMAPILEKLTKTYNDKAAIVFIDVWEEPDLAKKYKVSLIPTQIFFDKDGKEILRHQGFMSEEAIVEQLNTMGVQAPSV